ncbi:YoaK family protein [Branchiibius sp. NY16-3462-2]|uniref:YoaK family protein n=1 Tax=Branchiibius sp. NY16-3462-2 TaxID=1807500 RepID=UPI00079575E8|nr:YoaK family protein [Branchiibius sp. NY16-3462-2]KYH45927.1 hypothetical protein AZH51_09635 [Branchiibius sp. NY16-3462-2]
MQDNQTLRTPGDVGQVSALLMTMVSGYIDAHLFLRYQSFAFAQTGNVVFFAVALVQHHPWTRYLWPLLAYATGLALAQLLRGVRPALPRHFMVAVMVGQVAIFAVLAMLPAATPAAIFLVVLSLVGAIRLDLFRSAGGLSLVTIATTGNLMRLAQSVAAMVRDRRAGQVHAAVFSVLVVAAFAVGAFLGALATVHVSSAALWGAVAIEALALVSYLAASRP